MGCGVWGVGCGVWAVALPAHDSKTKQRFNPKRFMINTTHYPRPPPTKQIEAGAPPPPIHLHAPTTALPLDFCVGGVGVAGLSPHGPGLIPRPPSPPKNRRGAPPIHSHPPTTAPPLLFAFGGGVVGVILTGVGLIPARRKGQSCQWNHRPFTRLGVWQECAASNPTATQAQSIHT